MSNLQQLLWRSGPSAGSPNPVTQSNDHNTLRWPGTPPRVSPDRAASGQGRGHAIMTEGLPSKPIPSSWRAGRSSAPSREPRIANHPPATSPAEQQPPTNQPPRPATTRPHRVTLPPTPALWRTAMLCRVALYATSALGQRPITPTSAPLPIPLRTRNQWHSPPTEPRAPATGWATSPPQRRYRCRYTEPVSAQRRCNHSRNQRSKISTT